jgi:hypothetical protein
MVRALHPETRVVRMKYGIFLLIGGLALASLRRYLKRPADTQPTVGNVSEGWLLHQRGRDEQ